MLLYRTLRLTTPRLNDLRLNTQRLSVVLLAAIALVLPNSAFADSSPGWQEEAVIFHDGLDRWYRVYVPEDLPPNASLVLLLHGGGQSMRKIMRSTAGAMQHWPVTAEREKFLLVTPNAANPQTEDPKGDRQNWNDIRDSVPLGNSKEDDVGFLIKLLRHCHKTYGTDRSRTYVTGSSNGGMMTFRMLIDAPEHFAAGVAFIASLPDESPHIKQPALRTPLMMVNGTKDPLIKWNGGAITRGRGSQQSVPASRMWWVDALGADPTGDEEVALNDLNSDDGCRVYLTKHQPLDGGVPFWFYRVEGGGHSAPSIAHPLRDNILVRNLLGVTCRDVESSEIAWAFMKRFRRE